MTIFIVPWNKYSKSAKALALALKAKRTQKRVRLEVGDIIVNWGKSEFIPMYEDYEPEEILNHWHNVNIATCKSKTLNQLSVAQVPTVPFTFSIDVAKEWALTRKVVCRKLLRASEGRGIVIASSPEEVVDAPLYTKFVQKEVEYRVHVFNGKVIHTQQKKLRNGYKEIPNRNQYTRNLANGWVFTIQNVNCPQECQDISVKAVQALGLTFGAVDIAQTVGGKFVVFEVNTAPGIEGTTVDKYAEAINQYVTQQQ